MTPNPVYCIHCGAPLAAGVRFCEACGRPVSVCWQCGAALSPGARFCGTCGRATDASPPAQPAPARLVAPAPVPPDRPAAAPAPLPAQPVAAPPPPSPVAHPETAMPGPPAPPAGERVLGLIPFARRRKGLFGSETFNLVVTDGRIIFAQVTSQMLQDAAAQASEEAKAQGKGLLARTWATMTSGYSYANRYLAMPPEQIAAEVPGNFYLLHSQVSEARIRRGGVDSEGDAKPDELHITSAAGHFKLSLTNANSNDARQLLRQVLGSRAR